MQNERTSRNYFPLRLHTTVQAGNHPTSSLSKRISVRELLSLRHISDFINVWSLDGSGSARSPDAFWRCVLRFRHTSGSDARYRIVTE